MPQLLKKNAFMVCQNLLQTRMAETNEAMLAAQESANSNEKSSMGDKYETGRAMSQLERDMHAKQLAKLQDEYRKLLQVDVESKYSQIETGALVQTEKVQYWIAISLGQVLVDEQKIMVVSPLSPVAQAMLGKKIGDSFTINGNTQKLVKIS
ncbi:MAG: 3-oxoacyl-ACP synthase [Bacteroidetes bacterium B1(2017)]|nr:MAG: 3-oxoacyl-ACP synthase [Bacteroidetes bacterium B1(2017)]